MEFINEKTLTVTLKGSEIECLKSILNKFKQEGQKVSFSRKVFSEKESIILKKLYKSTS